MLRINPVNFAERHGLDENETLVVFLHAAKVGMLDFTWNMICSLCGRVEL